MSGNLTPTQIKRKKTIQGRISQTTGTLGLASLGAFTASKLPKSQRAVKLVPKLKKINSRKAETAALGLSTTGAGIGGVGSYNFAAYTKAEGEKKIKKNVEEVTAMEPVYGEEGIAKNWSATGPIHSSEYKRTKRAKAYEVGAWGSAAAASVGSLHQLHQGTKMADAAQKARGGTRAAKQVLSRKATGRGVLLGAAALGGGSAAEAIGHKRKSTWQPYAKRDSVSAFGVDHTDVTEVRN